MHTINCIGVNCVCDKIYYVNSTKYLGIIFDNTIRKVFYRFKTLRKFLNINCLRLVYTSLVQSILCYDLVVWGNSADVCMHKLNVTINLLLRFLLKKPYS